MGQNQIIRLASRSAIITMYGRGNVGGAEIDMHVEPVAAQIHISLPKTSNVVRQEVLQVAS